MRPTTVIRKLAAPALLLVAAAGCVMPDQLAQIQKDVADVRQEMQAARKEQAASRDRLAALEAKLDDGGAVKRSEIADLGLRLEEMQRELTAGAERDSELQRRVDRLAQDVGRAREASRRPAEGVPADLSPPSATTALPVPAAPGGAPAPDALYNQAYADFSKGNYALAISGFEEFASRFPESPLADNALYWIGECHFSEGHFDRAGEAFDRMLEKYPEGDRAPAANLKKGLAYLEENDVRSAIVQLRYVTTQYPASDEAKIAREKLGSLGAAGR